VISAVVLVTIIRKQHLLNSPVIPSHTSSASAASPASSVHVLAQVDSDAAAGSQSVTEQSTRLSQYSSSSGGGSKTHKTPSFCL